jgi:hypothetical protein
MTRHDGSRWARRAIALAGIATLFGSGGGMPDGPPEIGPWIAVGLSPARQVVQAGTPARFEAQALNARDPRYAWCLQPAGSASCNPVAGASGATLTLGSPTLADDGLQVKVTVTDPNGTGSQTARLRVSTAPPITRADGDFDPAAWSVQTVAEPASGGPGAEVATIAAGGHPGAWRRATLTVTPGAQVLRLEQLQNSFVHDPGLQGAILAIDVREDCIATGEATTTAYIDTLPMLAQGGRRYVASDAWRYDCQGLAQWAAAAARQALTAQDFRLVSGPACGAGESCPDFGAGGAPISFGYAHRMELNGQTPPGVRSRGIDNWTLTVWLR